MIRFVIYITASSKYLAMTYVVLAVNGGSGEIRTHDELPHAGFQDRCLQPLGHTSLFKA